MQVFSLDWNAETRTAILTVRSNMEVKLLGQITKGIRGKVGQVELAIIFS